MGSLDGHSNRVNSVACSPSGLLVTSSLDKSVRLWQPKQAAVSAAGCHTGEVTRAAISPSGRYLVTAGRDGWCHLWSKSGNTFEFKGKVQVRNYRWLGFRWHIDDVVTKIDDVSTKLQCLHC